MLKREFVALGGALANGGAAGCQVPEPLPPGEGSSAQILVWNSNSVSAAAALRLCPLPGGVSAIPLARPPREEPRAVTGGNLDQV